MITVDPISRRHREIGSRVELVADDLGRLAARNLGRTMPRTRIVVTDGTAMNRLAGQAESALAGRIPRARRAADDITNWLAHHRDAGCTVYDHHNILVIINAPAHRRHMEQVDKTVIHELAHAVQLSAADVRRDHTRYQQMRLGAQPPDDQFLTRYLRAMDIREQQARNLEALTA